MKKITLFLIMLGFFLTASAQYNFPPIVGPTTVVSGANTAINVNDVANVAGAPASSTGSYNSFSVTLDWVAGTGIPWSTEAELTLTTTAGSVTIDPPTTGGANNGDDTTLTFEGEFIGLYNPTTDGYLDLVFDQSYGGSQADYSNIVVTIFESPTCVEPLGMTSSGVTSDTAILDWTAGDSETDWNIEYNSDADFMPGNGEEEAMVSATGTPNTTLTGLTPATTYYLYYQANCGPGDLSFWVGPVTFATECVTFTAPFSEDFENAGEIPLCWSMSGGADWLFSDNAAGTHVGDNGTITGSTSSNNFFAWADASGDDGPRTLTSPLVDISTLATPALSFYEISDNEGNDNSTLEVEVWDGAAWNNMGTYDTNTNGWELKVLDLSGLTITGDVQARFIFSEIAVPGDFYDDIAIDDVTFDEAPTCFIPSMLMANAITSNSAELSWTQGGTAVSWNIEIVTSGTAATGTPTESGVTNPYTVNALAAITSYDYYVQADCGGGDISDWAGPFTFTTLCDVFIPDYIQSFATITPDCWEEADNGDITTGPLDIGNSSWQDDGFLNIGNTGAYKINMFGGANLNDWIISPLFDLTGGPFQVEFDFAITEWNSSDSTEPLDVDDTVQLLMTTDNGVTWIELLLYDSNSVVPIPGIHPVVDLTAYSGQIVQFAIVASEGTTAAANADVDVFIDNFRVRGIPTCPEPTDLTGNNLSLTSTEVGWTEAGVSTAWNIQYGEEGFALGTGTIESAPTNPHIINGLMPDTSYEYYVQAICGPGDLSSFNGPYQFFTGYCESIPTSNDGDGVSNVTLGITDFPSFGDVTYENHTATVVNVFQGIDTNVEVTFATGWTYNTNIWIDFNDNLVFEDSELVFQGESTNNNPTTLNASFVMPITAPAGEHRMRIGTADSGQATPDPCYGGSFGVTLDFTVNIEQLDCTLAEADYTAVPDCDNDQFFIDVNITSLGDATSLEISNNFDAVTSQALTTDIYQVGPFPFGTAVKIFVTNEQDNNCVISSDTFEVLACPPENDDCDGAIEAVVNEVSTCVATTPGTILAATPSGDPAGSCTGTPNDDVWFTFEALNEVQIISINNIVGGTNNIDHAVYEGTCGALTEIYCSDSESSVTPTLVVGNTYYVRVFSGGNQTETSTFDLCIRPAPDNIICANAENFCSEGGALTTPNIIDIDGFGAIACLGSSPNPAWNIIQIGDPGTIEIEINQTDDNGAGIDVDFVIWGPFTSVDDACINIVLEDCPTCPNNTSNNTFYPFGNIIDCSYSAAAVENLTIDNAQTGEIYMLLVTNFNGSSGNITIEQTNINGGDNGTIEAEIEAKITSEEVPIPEDNDPEDPDVVSVCGFDSITLDADSPFADEYIWYEDGFVIPNETSGTLTVTADGFGLGASNYQVQAFDNQCGSDDFSQVVVLNMYQDPGSIENQNITACDTPGSNGSVEFDLDELTTSLGLGADFTVSYYTNVIDANQAINAVSTPYTSSGETLIIRAEDADAATAGFLGCRQLSQVELVVNPRPVISQPADFIVCDDVDGSVDGVTDFVLTSINDDVTTEAGVDITYHTSQADADADAGALTSPYSSDGETIYVRAENTASGCFETTTFNLVVNIVPLADFDAVVYEVCPNATVPITIGIVPTNFSDSDVSVSWMLDGNPISGSGLTLNTVLVEGDYSATITFNGTGCTNTITVEVMELESCVFPQGISPGVTPGQNDNFDLRSFNVTKLEIFNRNGTLVYSKDNYTNEWVGQTNDGDDLPVGTYFYTVIYEGGAKSKSSWVYINR